MSRGFRTSMGELGDIRADAGRRGKTVRLPLSASSR